MSNNGESSSDMSDGEGVFDVEQIIDHLVVGDGETFYRVRWKGYGACSDTWEPKENLLTCEELLNTYIEREIENKDHSTVESSTDLVTVESSSSDDEKFKSKRSRPFNSKSTKRGRGGRGRGRGRGRGQRAQLVRRKQETDSSSSSDEPQVKDPFWEDLQQGKIDVFAGDLYSKIKKRRDPKSEDLSLPEVKSEEQESTTKRRIKSLQDELSTDKLDALGGSDSSDGNPANPLQFSDDDNIAINSLKTKDTNNSNENEVTSDNIEQAFKDATNLNMTQSSVGLIEKAPMICLTDIKLSNKTVVQYSETPTEDVEKEKKNLMNSEVVEVEEKEQKSEQAKDSTNIVSASIASPELEDVKLDENTEEKFQTLKQRLSLPSKLPEKKNIDSIFDKFDEKTIEESTKTTTKKDDMLPKLPKVPDKTPSAVESADNHKLKKTDYKEKKIAPTSFRKTAFDALEEELKSSPRNEKKIDSSLPVGKSLSSKLNKDEKWKRTKSEIGKSQLEKTIPDNSEFLALKVNFELDKISLKEIEHHHTEEPPCRVEKEISNSEFRQFIRNNNYEMVYEVLKSKRMMYNLEHQDSMWMTQIMIAAAAGCSEIVKVLAHYGARVNARTKNNSTALMYAAEKGHYLTTQVLLMYGAYVNLQTNVGETALSKAVKYGYIDVARCLLLTGADPSLKSTQGVNALNMEGVVPSNCVALARKHKCNVDSSISACIQSSLQLLGLKSVGLPLFALRTYNVRENALIQFNFNAHFNEIPPNQGLVLFAVHGTIGSGLVVKCRLRGPCHIVAVTVNNKVMEPLLPTKEVDKYSHFMTNLQWRKGQNSIKVILKQDGLSKEKIYFIANVVGFG